VIKALHAIHARQTADEQAGGYTNHTNGIGFSKFDAPFLTDMVVKHRRYGSLTPKQMAVTRNKIKRYWRQLVEIANERDAVKVPSIRPVPDPEQEEARMVEDEVRQGEHIARLRQVREELHAGIPDFS
jgi:hypothetical protein